MYLLKINNYNECNKIGSTSWCINRNEGFYNRYKNFNNEFFIWFDTKKEKNDPESMIGFHMKKENNEFKIDFSHLKNDNTTNSKKRSEIIEFAEKNSAFFDSFLDINKKNTNKNKII